jgi:SHS2 domain-containing protein
MYVKDTSKFDEIEHTADIGIEANGETLPEMFANLAFGMLHIITGRTESQLVLKRTVKIKGPSLTDLLVGWLSEMNYLLTVCHYLTNGIEIQSIEQKQENFVLKADLFGQDSRPIESNFETEIKAVTYHKLMFEMKDNEYVGQVIFDI